MTRAINRLTALLAGAESAKEATVTVDTDDLAEVLHYLFILATFRGMVRELLLAMRSRAETEE